MLSLSLNEAFCKIKHFLSIAVLKISDAEQTDSKQLFSHSNHNHQVRNTPVYSFECYDLNIAGQAVVFRDHCR